MPAAKAAQLARLNRQGDAGKGGGSQSFEKLAYKCCHSIIQLLLQNPKVLVGYDAEVV